MSVSINSWMTRQFFHYMRSQRTIKYDIKTTFNICTEDQETFFFWNWTCVDRFLVKKKKHTDNNNENKLLRDTFFDV